MLKQNKTPPEKDSKNIEDSIEDLTAKKDNFLQQIESLNAQIEGKEQSGDKAIETLRAKRDSICQELLVLEDKIVKKMPVIDFAAEDLPHFKRVDGKIVANPSKLLEHLDKATKLFDDAKKTLSDAHQSHNSIAFQLEHVMVASVWKDEPKALELIVENPKNSKKTLLLKLSWDLFPVETVHFDDPDYFTAEEEKVSTKYLKRDGQHFAVTFCDGALVLLNAPTIDAKTCITCAEASSSRKIVRREKETDSSASSKEEEGDARRTRIKSRKDLSEYIKQNIIFIRYDEKKEVFDEYPLTINDESGRINIAWDQRKTSTIKVSENAYFDVKRKMIVQDPWKSAEEALLQVLVKEKESVLPQYLLTTLSEEFETTTKGKAFAKGLVPSKEFVEFLKEGGWVSPASEAIEIKADATGNADPQYLKKEIQRILGALEELKVAIEQQTATVKNLENRRDEFKKNQSNLVSKINDLMANTKQDAESIKLAENIERLNGQIGSLDSQLSQQKGTLKSMLHNQSINNKSLKTIEKTLLKVEKISNKK